MRETTLDRSETTTDRALARIAVQRPYFALEQLDDLGSGVVSAVVPPSPPRTPERGTIEAAQVARHLAILGSCAAALARDDGERHHYLATSAHYMRLACGPELPSEAPLRAEAIASWVDRRTARASVKLMTDAGRGLHVLDVHYSVLSPKMFARLHPPIAATVADGNEPSALIEGPAEVIHGGLRFDCGPVPAALCAGHFPGYPAAPVAIVMGQLCRVAGLSLAAHLDRQVDYRIEEGRVEASKLAVAGQRLVLEAVYGHAAGPAHVMHGLAMADGTEIGRVDVALSTSHDGVAVPSP